MISYRPSIGNNETKVGITNAGSFFGKSTGDALLLSLRSNTTLNPSYYTTVYTDISNDSSWFFKPITDNDFITGSTTYRAMYIGASERYTENEILGTISTSVSNDNGNILLNNSVKTSLWMESDFYTELSSKGSLSLQNEDDTYNQLSSAVWTDSITCTNTLLPGQFIKIWIKIEVPSNAAIVNFGYYNYLITIGDLVIPVSKTPSRLSYSRLFKSNLNDDTLILKEALSAEFGTGNFNGVFKVIKRLDYANIFYFKDDGPEFNLLVAKTGHNLGEYKYINVPLTPIFADSQPLVEENYQQYIEMMTCQLPITISSGNVETSISGANLSVTVSTSGSYKTELSNILPTKKFILDVFMSTKEDINYAYVYYAELHTEYTQRDILNYQNVFFKWVFKVATFDLNHINDKLFLNVSTGYENLFTSLVASYYDATIKHYFFPSNIIVQNDLFTVSGFETEDCYFKDYKGKLLYIWEKDLILRNLTVQESVLPQNEYSNFRTIKNVANNPTILTFDNLTQVVPSTDFDRSFISGSYSFINLGPPHSRAIEHGTSAVMYDLYTPQINEYNTTWSFSVDSTNLTASGSKASLVAYDLFNPKAMHAAYASDYNSISGGNTVMITGSAFINQSINIFSLNCQDDLSSRALNVAYDFHTDIWEITRKDSNDNVVTESISGGPILYTDQQSVVTVDIYSHEVSGGTTTDYYDEGFRINNGCIKRNIIKYAIYVNGSLLSNDTTCSLNNVNIYQITHNPDGQFMGKISYWDIRKPVKDLPSYISALHKIHLNTVWGSLGAEKIVNSTNPMINNFNCRRKVTLNHLTPFKDSMVIPLILYGNSYNMSTYNNKQLNSEVTRSTFSFNKLSLNKKSFGFFIDKTFVPIDFEVDYYDFDSDIIVIWLNLENWQGESIQMFYSDAILVPPENKNVFKNYYGFWKMDSFIEETLNRVSNQKVFDVGETLLMTQKNSNIYLTLINNVVRFGDTQLYKSNNFDIEFDDLEVLNTQMEPVTEFISETAGLFKPGFMEIRDVKSKYPYKLETNNTGDI